MYVHDPCGCVLCMHVHDVCRCVCVCVRTDIHPIQSQKRRKILKYSPITHFVMTYYKKSILIS